MTDGQTRDLKIIVAMSFFAAFSTLPVWGAFPLLLAFGWWLSASRAGPELSE